MEIRAQEILNGSASESPASISVQESVPGNDRDISISLSQPREAMVRCLWYRSGNNSAAEGGTSPLIIRVSPNPSGGTPVAIAEDFVKSTGSTWRASAWIAAFCASHAADTLIIDHEFLVKAGGFIDGPSAGMLMTATMTALLRGEAVLPNTSMTGTVNPDGSVGPVGGIVQKMEGARDDGIKRFGFPIGCRINKDVNTDEYVDLIEKAREMGIEAFEIGDINDAYRLMTGKLLPRPVPVDESKMSIPIALAQRVRGATLSLRGDSLQQFNELERAFKSRKITNVNELNLINAYLKRSEMAEKDGNLALAFRYAQLANAAARVKKLRFEMQTHVQSNNRAAYQKVGIDQGEATVNTLDSLRISLKSGMDRITVGGKVDALHSYLIYWQGRAQMNAGLESYRAMANAEKDLAGSENEGKNSSSKTKKESQDELQKKIDNYKAHAEEATDRFAFAQCRAESAARWSNFAQEGGNTVRVNPELYERLGRAYSTAAMAGLGWFESMFIEDVAKEAGVSSDLVHRVYLIKDSEFAAVSAAANFAGYSSASGTKEALAPLDQLASGVFAYHGAAQLLNKRYNYRAIEDEENGYFELTQRKSLGHALDLARRRVLEEAARVEKTAGFIPDSIKLNYDLANVLRDGSDHDKIGALTTYWTCVFLCDLTRMLSSAE